MTASISRLGLALFLLLFLASACATQGRLPEQKAEPSPARQSRDTSRKNASTPREVPSSVDSALLPQKETDGIPPEQEREPRSSAEPRFDVRANEVSARQFFMSLVRETPYSLTIHPRVQGTITLQMQNVTLPQVLEAVRNLYGYPYRRTGSGYQILPSGTVSRTFHVDYLDLTRQGGSKTQVRSGSVSGDGEGDSNAPSVTSTEISTESESAFWSELENTLTSLVGQGDNRRVITQPQAGLVVVRAMPRELQQVEQYLDTMQQNVQRQVILEAKIMEVRLNEGHQTGINWSGLLSGSDEWGGVISQTGGGTAISGGNTPSSGNSLDLSPNNPDLTTGRSARAFGGAFSTAVNIRNFTAFIELLKEQGEVNVLSSPRVATMNNQKAVIKVGTDQFFVTDVSTETDEDETGGDTQINDVTLDPFFSGIALDVTPYISRNDLVTMHIHPSVSNVEEVTKNLKLGQDQNLSLPLAQSEVRESDSIVKAKDGEIVVIGGLMKSRMSDEQASVPFLGDVPLLGYLFRHEKQVQEKSELVILLRPRVIGYGQESARMPEAGDLNSENFGRQWRGGRQ